MSRKDVTDAMVVRACADYQAARATPFALELLVQRTGQPEKVCFAALERAYSRGLIECGVSLRSAWPTSAGLELLAREPVG
jgi:hypothetical protein